MELNLLLMKKFRQILFVRIAQGPFAPCGYKMFRNLKESSEETQELLIASSINSANTSQFETGFMLFLESWTKLII